MKKIISLSILLLAAGCAFISNEAIIPSEKQYEDGLPIIYIHPNPPSKDEYTDISFTFKGRVYEARGKIRGAGSLSYPKNNYTLKFKDEELFTFNDNLQNQKKIVLISNFDDPTYIKQRLAYELWNKLDNTFRMESGNCVVYMNGRYHGVYTVLEGYNEEYIERLSATGKINSGGNLFKAARHEANFFINESEFDLPIHSNDLAYSFEKKVGYPEAGTEGAYDDLIELITDLNSVSSEDSYSYLTTKLSIEDFISWMSFTTFLRARDSVGNNCYYYHDLVTDKWYYAPWDFNVSFGATQNLEEYENSGPNLYSDVNRIFEHISSNERLLQEYNSYNREILYNTKEYSMEEMESMIDALYSEISAAAIKDSRYWREDREEYYGDSVEISFEESIDDIKSWIDEQYDTWLEYYE